jgi:O-acetyl-ADP-ribose deacetylase (regulator of RNase III)
MRTLRVGRATIELRQGDITTVPADAIVNAANSALAGGGGVDGAIHRAGGPTIMAELADRYGPGRHCPTGGAVHTGAGDLPARWVIHAVGPIWRGGTLGEPELLASAYRTSLDLAAELGARTVTFPAISCGVYGYPLNRAAEIAIGTAREWLGGTGDSGTAGDGQGIQHVIFVLFSSDTLDAFERALDSIARA